MSVSEDQLVAFHEAAHAVLAHDRGCKIHFLTTLRESCDAGETAIDSSLPGSELLWDPEQQDRAEAVSQEAYGMAQNRSVVYWAGAAAQKRLEPEKLDLMRVCVDRHKLRSQARSVTKGEVEEDQFVDRAKTWAEAAIATYRIWRAIEALGRDLQGQPRRIEGEEAHRLIVGYLGQEEA